MMKPNGNHNTNSKPASVTAETGWVRLLRNAPIKRWFKRRGADGWRPIKWLASAGAVMALTQVPSHTQEGIQTTVDRRPVTREAIFPSPYSRESGYTRSHQRVILWPAQNRAGHKSHRRSKVPPEYQVTPLTDSTMGVPWSAENLIYDSTVGDPSGGQGEVPLPPMQESFETDTDPSNPAGGIDDGTESPGNSDANTGDAESQRRQGDDAQPPILPPDPVGSDGSLRDRSGTTFLNQNPGGVESQQPLTYPDPSVYKPSLRRHESYPHIESLPAVQVSDVFGPTMNPAAGHTERLPSIAPAEANASQDMMSGPLTDGTVSQYGPMSNESIGQGFNEGNFEFQPPAPVHIGEMQSRDQDLSAPGDWTLSPFEQTPSPTGDAAALGEFKIENQWPESVEFPQVLDDRQWPFASDSSTRRSDLIQLLDEPAPVVNESDVLIQPEIPIRRPSLISTIPEMFGDILLSGRCATIEVSDASTAGYVPLLGMGQKIGENNSPLPRHRVYYTFNYFNDAASYVFRSGPFLGAGTSLSGDESVYRHTLGVEIPFLSDRYSIELRMPMDHRIRIDDEINGDKFSFATGGIANAMIIGKHVFKQTDRFVWSGGVGVELPSGRDSATRVNDLLTRFDNQTVHIHPFMALGWTPNERWFFESFMQVDAVANGSPVFLEHLQTESQQFLGRLNPPNVLHVDLMGGKWLYRDRRDRLAHSVAAIMELHSVSSFGNRDFLSGGLESGGDDFVVECDGNALSPQFDYLNMTLGLHFERVLQNLRLAGVIPLSSDHAYDGELILQWNFRR